jgi:hypothetical protein
MARARQRCRKCDAVLDDNGSCFFCDPRPDHKLRPVGSVKDQRRIDRIGTLMLVSVTIFFALVIAQAAGFTLLDHIIAAAKFVGGFGDQSDGSANDIKQPALGGVRPEEDPGGSGGGTASPTTP